MFEELKLKIEKLDVKPGDTLVFTYDAHAPHEMINAHREVLPELATALDVRVVSLSSDFRIEHGDLIESAWGLLANVSNGEWSQQSDEWQAAVALWRGRYHKYLDALRGVK